MVFGSLFGGGSKTVHEVELRGDSKDLESAAGRAQGSLTGALVKSQLMVQALNKAFQVTKQVIGDVVKNSVEYERTVLQQTAALSRYGTAARDLQSVLMQQASTLQDLTAISDEEVRSVQTLALNYGVATQDVDRYVRAAIRMANVTGRSVQGSLEQLIKTEQGLIDRTLKVIPGISDLTKEQLQQGEAIDLVNDKWAEFIDVKAQGALGQVNQLKNAYADLTEALGNAAREQDTFFDSLTSGITEWMSAAAAITREQGFLAGMGALVGSFTGGPFAAMLGLPGAEGVFETAEAARWIEEQRAFAAERRTQLEGGTGPTPRPEGPGERGGGGGGGIEFDVGGIGEDMVMLASGEMVTQSEFEARSQRYQEGLQEVVDATIAQNEIVQAIYAAENEQWERSYDLRVEASKRALKEIEALEKQHAAEVEQLQQRGINAALGAVSGFVRMNLDALRAMRAGEEIEYQEMLRNFLEATGSRLLGQGIAHLLTGVANLYFGNPAGALQAKIGGIEIATGAAMMAGSLVVPAGVGEGGTAGGGSGGGSSAFAGGGRRSNVNEGSERTLIINVSGAAITDAGVGVAIYKSLAEASRHGLLG